MRWYVDVQGQPSGPWSEAEVVERIKRGEFTRACHICPVGAKEWTSISTQQVFDAAMHEVAPPPLLNRAVSAGQSLPSRAKAQGISPGARLVIWLLALILVVPALKVLGAVISLAMMGFAELARRRNGRSFVSWVLKREPSRGQSIASLALGTVLFLCASTNFFVGVLETRQKEQEEQARREQVERDLADKALRRSALLVEMPSRILAWQTRLDELADGAEATRVGSGHTDGLAQLEQELSATIALLGAETPEEMKQIATRFKSVKEKYAARARLEQAIENIEQKVAKGREEAASQNWMNSDALYESALTSLDEISQSPESLRRFLPPNFSESGKRREIEGLRAKIATPVARERRKKDHAERLARIKTLDASLDSNNRQSYENVASALAGEISKCGRCEDAGMLKKKLASVKAELEQWPIEISSIQELQNRYADLRGSRARVKGMLSVSTYYNCKFDSQSAWRSLQLSDTLFGGLHVYCRRGDEGCESLFQPLAGGGYKRGTAIVEYPSWNQVCEEGQAYLVGWSSD